MLRFLLLLVTGLLPYASYAVTVSATATPTACTPCNGTITATATAGTAPYQYSIDGGVTWQSSGAFTALCAATYTVTARDAAMSTATTTATVVQNPPLSFTASGVNCSAINLCDGQIVVNITGGVPPYTIRVQNGPSTQYFTSSPITNRCAGTYTVSVVDASNNCGNGYMTPVVVVIGAGPAHGPNNLYCTTSYAVGQCHLLCDNTLTVAGQGGTPPYQYSVNGGPYSSATTYNGLCEGPNTYTVCVRDAAMNTWCVQAFYPTNYPYMRFPPNVTAAGCACSGTITFLNPTFGEMFYVYQNSVLIGQNSTGSFTGLCAGTYNVSAFKDGCWLLFTVTVPSNPPMTLSATASQPACYNSCNGIVTATLNNGSNPPYQYSKDAGVTWQSSATFSGLCAGTYTIVGRNSLNCTATQTVVVNSTPAVTASATSSDPVCFGGCNGSVTAAPLTGPADPYQYSIDGNTWHASNLFSGLCAGSYTLQVKDSFNCITSVPVVLNNPPPVMMNVASADPLCHNDCNGAITLNSSAPAGYTYSIDSGATFVSSGSFTNLCAGNYGVVIHDANGCADDSLLALNNPPDFVTGLFTVPVSCSGFSDGELSVLTLPGGPYQYSIDTGLTWQSSNVFDSLAAGSYYFQVQDADGCIGVVAGGLAQPPQVTITLDSIINASCNGACDGEIYFTPSGWFGSTIDSGAHWQSVTQYTSLCAGEYVIVLENASGCRDTAYTSITQPDPLTLQAAPTDNLCYGDTTGSVQLSSNATNAQYSVDGGTTWSSDSAFHNLAAGTYTVLLTDGNGCTSSASFALSSPPQLVLSTSCTYSSYCDCNGFMAPFTSGGVPGYSYSVTPGNSTSGLCAGSYLITVTDTNGCTSAAPFVIPSALPLTIDSVVSTPAVAPNNNGTATVYYSGGYMSYNVQWEAAAGPQWGSTATNLAPGTYCVWVYDASGCEDSACVTVGVITEIEDVTAEYSLYPNPASDAFTISGLQSIAVVTLYDLQGRVVVSYGNTDMNPTGTTFELPHGIAAGNYVVEIVQEDVIVREKLVIQR